MFLQPYQPHEIRFAYCYRVYLRWQTKRRRPFAQLGLITAKILNDLVRPYKLRVLVAAASETEVLVIVSLQPRETISSCVSKLKGRVSKWLTDRLHLNEPTKLLGKGYFGCTVGKSRAKAIDRYLDTQGAHHGYDKRVLPPVFLQQYPLRAEDEARLAPPNAVVIARFHLVLSTRQRRGVFGAREGQLIATEWRKQQAQLRIAIMKVSFVPDHVHIALRMHPAVSPAEVVVGLMNAAQELMQEAMVQAGVDRLWEPAAYVGAFGDLASPQVRKYIENLELD